MKNIKLSRKYKRKSTYILTKMSQPIQESVGSAQTIFY